MVITMDTYWCIPIIIIYFSYIPSSITVRKTMFVMRGATVNLSCPFKAVTTPISWQGPPNLTIYSKNRKINRQIDNVNRIFVNGNIEKHQYNLSISNFTSSDTGLYRCDTLINRRSMRHELVVHIAEPPTRMTIVNETKEGTLVGEQNSLLNLICTVDSAIPQNTLEIKFENTSLMSNSSEYILHVFVARKHHHLKHFECIAENLFYRIAKDVQLYIYLYPVVHVYAEPSAKVEEGNDITIICLYESNLKETVLRWRRNGKLFLNTQYRNLTLKNVSSEDSGLYRCEVENRIGNGTDTIIITVLYKPIVVNHSYTFEIESDFGKPAFISFTIASGTKPFIAWTHDLGGKTGYWNVQDIGNEKYNVSSTIVPNEKSHLGRYAVRVRNAIGSISLNIDLVGFKVHVYPSNLVCNMSNVIELTCNVSQYTSVNLSNIWVHSYDGTEIRSLQGNVDQKSSKLRIAFCDYRDAGTYTCMWKSSMIMQSFSSTIYVQSHPVLTAVRTFEEYGKTLLRVCFYSFPPPLEALWFYKDKPISQNQLSAKNSIHETEVKLLINAKSVFVNGYVVSYQINRTRSTAAKYYSCQIRNIMGNLDVSFHELNKTINVNTSNIGSVDVISTWLKYVLIGSFLTGLVVVIIVIVLFYRYSQGNSRKSSGQNVIQREQEDVSRNSSQSSNHHSYEEVDNAYYHTVEWRNYTIEASRPENNDMAANIDVSVGSRDSDKTGDGTELSQNDGAINSYMELF